MKQPTVALTGATGFLGRHLLWSLTARGYNVRALSRSGRVDGVEADVVTGDLGDPAALADLVHGVDAIVHAAGLIKASRAAAFHEVNAEGTARLLRCAIARAPGAHVLLVSSLAAREPQLSPYAASKRTAELYARRLVAVEKLTIVRPPALYGPHDRETLAVFKAARLPLTPLPVDHGEHIALMHVADASHSIAGLLCPAAAGLFSLADKRPQGYRMREILGEAGRAQGRKVRLVRVPRPVLRMVGAALAGYGRLSGTAAVLSPGKVKEMLHKNWSVHPHEMPPGLLAQARDLRTGFRQTVEWYRASGWL